MARVSRRTVLWTLALVAGTAVALLAGRRVGHELAHWREKRDLAERIGRMGSGEAAGLRAGDAFPSVTLVGRAASLPASADAADLVIGNESLIFFMSAECAPCTESARRWSRERDELPDAVALFGVIDVPPAARDRYTADTGITFPVWSDSTDTFGREHGLDVYPTIVAVDATGRVVYVRHGVDEGFSPKVAADLMRAERSTAETAD